METAQFRIWTRFSISISFNNNHYARCAPIQTESVGKISRRKHIFFEIAPLAKTIETEMNKNFFFFFTPNISFGIQHTCSSKVFNWSIYQWNFSFNMLWSCTLLPLISSFSNCWHQLSVWFLKKGGVTQDLVSMYEKEIRIRVSFLIEFHITP